MTVLQSARSGCNTDEITAQNKGRMPPENVNTEESVRSSGDTDLTVYCEYKFRSLSEGELQTLVKVTEDFIPRFLGGLVVSGSVYESLHVCVVGVTKEEGQGYESLTPAKVVSGVSNVADNLRFPNKSPLKRSVGVAFVINEEEQLMCEVNQSGIKRRSNDGEGSRMMVSTGGLTNETRLPEIDEMVGRGPSTGPANAPVFGEPSLRIELPPREKLVSREKFSKRNKYNPSQSAKTLLKVFFELNSPTILDPGHTTSFSANQINQFGRVVGLEITLT